MRCVSRRGVGFGILDIRTFAALAFCSVAALVCDRVFRPEVVGVDTIYCLRFMTLLVLSSSCVVDSCTLRTGACTAGVGGWAV